jgi:hypothetical protein
VLLLVLKGVLVLVLQLQLAVVWAVGPRLLAWGVGWLPQAWPARRSQRHTGKRLNTMNRPLEQGVAVVMVVSRSTTLYMLAFVCYAMRVLDSKAHHV